MAIFARESDVMRILKQLLTGRDAAQRRESTAKLGIMPLGWSASQLLEPRRWNDSERWSTAIT